MSGLPSGPPRPADIRPTPSPAAPEIGGALTDKRQALPSAQTSDPLASSATVVLRPLAELGRPGTGHSGPRHMIIEMLGTIVCASRARGHDGPRCCDQSPAGVRPTAQGNSVPHPAIHGRLPGAVDPVSVPVGGRKGRLTVVAKVRVSTLSAQWLRNGRQAGHADPCGGRWAFSENTVRRVKKPRSGSACCQTQHR